MSSDKAVISDVNFVVDLVRQQGEELLRVRKELELAQKVNAASIEVFRATERHIGDLQQNCSQWCLRFSNIGLELVALKTENDTMASQLEASRADLRTALGLTNPSESYVESEQPIEDRIPSLSTSIAVASEESDSDGYTSISFSDISGTRGTIGRPGATNCPIPEPNVTQVGTTECATSDDSLEVDASVSERNCDEELGKESHTGTEIVIEARSDEEATVRPESLHVLDADKNETKPIPKSDSSEAATVDLDQKNGDVSVTPSTKQLMSGSLDGIPRDVDHLVKCLTIESLKPVCSKLPSTDTNEAVKALCLKAIGPVAETSYHVLKFPETLLAYPNTNNRTLITVSKSAKNLSCHLKQLKSGWKGHILLQNSSAGELYYLGEYESGGGCRMTDSEYDSLPEETQLYISNYAKPQMSKKPGIYTGKTELRFIGYSAMIKNQLGKEARQNGYIEALSKNVTVEYHHTQENTVGALPNANIDRIEYLQLNDDLWARFWVRRGLADAVTAIVTFDFGLLDSSDKFTSHNYAGADIELQEYPKMKLVEPLNNNVTHFAPGRTLTFMATQGTILLYQRKGENSQRMFRVPQLTSVLNQA
ncbi:hypothetical protein BT96DRAFT_977899 [Gymnopus androsaceus JB14]|uniref:Uncharacterized protein n=1 Tax=Gymnopus androsaceus JB14 TaxID=1447944 RepID=A0A6A4HCW7_9AGAR|nr:hypothetical protein BT96DRAFT_977899 [Gymnopus androsaceus JB14]